ncbi:MAG: DEAD/DEAH box helicase [Candidatus Sulfotelmatobacter sp.]
MAFKKAPPKRSVPDSPDELLRDLPRRKIPDVLPHQREIMRSYAETALADPDVALQLPTGSGKTLVGLLIAEWRRRKNQERVVYLCTTRQLVNQVIEQAEEKYGLTVLGFTGPIKNFKPAAKAEYWNGDRIAVTTYSSLFNTNAFFKDADVVIVDDVHAGEGYISGMWSVRVERNKPEHKALHAALRNVLRSRLDLTSFSRLEGKWDSPFDRGWVDKLPTPELVSAQAEIAEVLDAHVPNTELSYPWSMLRDHLAACQLYFSSQEILIRPLIPPTWVHSPFSSPRQRIYMSATLGSGGDLERLVGRHPIRRLPVPQGWDRQGVGRRFFIFPDMSLQKEGVTILRRQLMEIAGRSLVLVPSDRLRAEIAEDVEQNLKFKTFSADDIEDSKKPFVTSKKAVAIVASRYDGIDFPGNECRLLFIEGLPKATNLQEKFLMARMGANVLFNERIQTRVLQAIGRCTRSLEDFSAVVVSGEELPEYLTDIKRKKFLHPELQAELSFGVEQSKGTTTRDMIDNFKIFLENGEDWENVNQQILVARRQEVQKAFPAMADLSKVVPHEIAFQTYLWSADYDSALSSAESVLGGLDAPELRGYRALWHYLAGAAAWLGAEAGATGLAAKARTHFDGAKSATHAIQWLVRLARYQSPNVQAEAEDTTLMEQIERVETMLTQLGTVHDRSFAIREKEILEGLESEGTFEQAHKSLGEMLGFEAGKIEDEGSPDPWWIVGEACFVFEDHAGAQENATIDVKKARQVSSHPDWMRANVPASREARIVAVLVTPAKKVSSKAVVHLHGVALWPIDEMRQWARTALATIREVRKTFVEAGDLTWRARAAELFQQNNLSARPLFERLQNAAAAKLLKSE